MRRYLPGLAGPAPVPEIGLSADVIGSCQSVTSAVFFSGRLVMASPAPAFSSHIDMRNITQGKSLNMSVLDMRTCMFLDANHHLLGCEPALFLGFGFANLHSFDCEISLILRHKTAKSFFRFSFNQRFLAAFFRWKIRFSFLHFIMSSLTTA